MAKKKENWIQGAVEHPGAFTAKAKRAGISVGKFAAHVLAHTDKYSTKTVDQAKLARTLRKLGRSRKRRRHA